MRTSYIILLVSSYFLHPPAQAQVHKPLAAQPAASPGQAYILVASDCLKLLRQAAALPDAQGVALLRQQAPPLQARARPVTQAYARWLKTLSPTQTKAEEDRIMHSDFARQIESFTTKPMGKHSPAFNQLAGNLMQAMTEGL